MKTRQIEKEEKLDCRIKWRKESIRNTKMIMCTA